MFEVLLRFVILNKSVYILGSWILYEKKTTLSKIGFSQTINHQELTVSKSLITEV